MAHFGRFYYPFFVLYRIIVLYNTETNHWTDFVMDFGKNYVHPHLGIFLLTISLQDVQLLYFSSVLFDAIFLL